jgi:hypothetical protein
MPGTLVFNSRSNEYSLAPQFKWLEYTFNMAFLSFNNFRKKKQHNLCRSFHRGYPFLQ